mgnify:CR=1 FL=1
MSEGDQVIIQAIYNMCSKREHTVINHVLLCDVRVNGELFRDHVWVKKSKVLCDEKFEKGDKICCTGIVEYYLNIDDAKSPKVGFRHIRNVCKEK